MPESEHDITWHVVTHDHRERTTDWYWTLGLVALVGAAISIYFSNILFAIILVVGIGSIGFLVARGPREHVVRIDKRGVSVDGTLHPFRTMHSFWVEEDTEYPRLFLSNSGVLSSHMTIPLENVSHASSVRNFLRRHVEEVEQEPRFAEQLAELLGL